MRVKFLYIIHQEHLCFWYASFTFDNLLVGLKSFYILFPTCCSHIFDLLSIALV